MERRLKEEPVALIVGGSSPALRREAAELRRLGHELRTFDTAWDALAIFGEVMPALAVMGPLPPTPCLALLLEDLARYDVPIVRPGTSSHSAEKSIAKRRATDAHA